MWRKTVKKIHLWLAVPFGIVIVCSCLTGAALVFEKEITEWIYHDFYYVENKGSERVKVSEVLEKVEATLTSEKRIRRLIISSDPSRTWQVELTSPDHWKIFVNPYTGAVEGSCGRPAFFSAVRKIHKRLSDHRGVSVGSVVIGISTAAFVLILASGLVLWIPRTRKGLKTRLKISSKFGRRRFLHDWHVAMGFYAVLFLFVMSVTGVYRVGGFFIDEFESDRNGKRMSTGASRMVDATPLSGFGAWEKALSALVVGDTSWHDIEVSEGKVKKNGGTNPGKYLFDGKTGELTGFMGVSLSEKMQELHEGTWGGPVTRILALIAALIGATLPFSGYYLWMQRTGVNRRKPAVR